MSRPRSRLPLFLAASLCLHGTAVWVAGSILSGGSVWQTSGTESPEGIEIEVLVGGEDAGDGGPSMRPPGPGLQQRGRPGARGSGGGESERGQAGVGSSPAPTTTHSVLSEIRARIEGVKRYPEAARRMQLGGRVVVRFRIDAQGGVVEAAVTHSSGSDLLDDAALETVRRAAPLSFFPDPLSIALKFEP